MVLGEDPRGTPAFHFSFDPEIVTRAWISLRARILLTTHDQINHLDNLFAQFSPITPDYKLVMQFSQLLLKYLPDQSGENGNKISEENLKIANSKTEIPQRISPTSPEQIRNRDDIELLQAIAHEVRTPLATIRTLTRLLKRRHLEPDIIKYLEMIDRECTEQIDRFGLIFRAVELETCEPSRSPMNLTATSLTKVFEESIHLWQKQASRRNLTLDINLPQQMPAVVSDPTMLDQVLTGLIENFTSSLPTGSHIQVKVMLAGSQLKLQLQSQDNPNVTTKSQIPICNNNPSSRPYPIGHLLMFQPETGNLSLNLNVTKNLFQALGGKLIVRQKSQKSQVLTIFLPLTEF
jgi:signal transduction histidine kinase